MGLGNLHRAKQRPEQKIDAVVALVMAVGRADDTVAPFSSRGPTRFDHDKSGNRTRVTMPGGQLHDLAYTPGSLLLRIARQIVAAAAMGAAMGAAWAKGAEEITAARAAMRPGVAPPTPVCVP